MEETIKFKDLTLAQIIKYAEIGIAFDWIVEKWQDIDMLDNNRESTTITDSTDLLSLYNILTK